MAKSSKSDSAAAPVVAAQPSASTSAGDAKVTADPSSRAAETQPPDTMVIEWDPQEMGKESSWQEEGGLDAGTGKKVEKRGEADVSDADDAVVVEGADTVKADEPGEEPDAPKTDKDRAARRAHVLRALAREKGQRGAEDQARQARADAEAAKAEIKKLNDRIESMRTGSLEQRLAAAGLTQDEITDAILMGGIDKDKLPKKADGASEEVKALRAELVALKETLKDKETKAEEAAVKERAEQVRIFVLDTIKDMDVPLVKDLGAEGRVVEAARKTWIALGKKGNASDYIPAAAEVIEEQLEKERPNLAALKKRTAAEGGEPKAPPAKRPPVPAVGRRTAPARPARETKPLSMDADERTRQIIKEMGW